MPIHSKKPGSLLRRPVPRTRTDRDDDARLFSTEANASRLREAIADARADRNMIPFSPGELRREFDRGAE